MIVQQVIPSGAIRAVILTYRAPGTLAQIRTPALPVLRAPGIFLKPYRFTCRHGALSYRLPRVPYTASFCLRCCRDRKPSAASGSAVSPWYYVSVPCRFTGLPGLRFSTARAGMKFLKDTTQVRVYAIRLGECCRIVNLLGVIVHL